MMACIQEDITMLRKRKVHGIFDNGTALVHRSQYMLQEDATIGDAVSCFQKHHALVLWKTPSVELVGILSEKDLRLPYGHATSSETHASFKIQDVMESNDFLVFRSARPQAVKGDAADGQGGTIQETQESTEKKERTSPNKSTRQAIRLAAEEKRLADYLSPPLTERHHGKRHHHALPNEGTVLDASARSQSVKRAKLKHAMEIETESPCSRQTSPKQKQGQKKPTKDPECKYSGRTPCEGPFPDCDKPGTLIVQETRRVYVCCADETPFDIETKFGIDAGKIVYDNRPLYPKLCRKSRLLPLTAIVLPLEGTASSSVGTSDTSKGDSEWCQETIGDAGSGLFTIYSKKSDET